MWPAEQAAAHQDEIADGGYGERRTGAANHATTASGRVDKDGGREDGGLTSRGAYTLPMGHETFSGEAMERAARATPSQ